MSEDFKYLGNHPGTSLYPTLDNLNVQKTVTQFNWSLWGSNTKIYLKHVPASWSSDYSNVVKFENKAARDNYLKTENPITLETEFRISHDGRIRLPIPYDNLINYNYLVAEYPDAPVPGYETSTARKNYYYFIEDCEYIAPNTTEIKLELDIWTTYLDEISIDTLQLERGHYPMTLSNVDSYLANPLNNRIGLDTVDVNFGELSKIPQNHKTDLMGEKVYLVATTSNPKTFTKNVTTHNGNGMHPGLYYFCIKAENWVDWCKATASKTPAFFQTIKGILILQDVLFNFTENFDFNGIKCYSYSLNKSLVNYTFTKSDFGYDSKYKWITKLYTSPYAMIEVIDPNGNKQQIKYEDLYVGKMAINLFGAVSLNNSTLKAIVMNIGGNSSNGDFNQITVDIPLPNASVNLSPSVKYLFETEYPRIQQQNDINTSYNTGIASAKTGKTNADASAATGKTNANASAATGKTNADASTNTSYAITLAGLNLSKELIEAQTADETGYMMQNMTRDLDRQTEIVTLENEILAYNNLVYNNLANNLKDINQQAQALNYVFAGANQMLGAGSSMGFNAAQNGSAPGLAAAGSVFTGGVTSALSGVNLLMTMGLADDKQELVNSTNTLQKDNAIAQNKLKLNQSKIYALDKLSILQADMTNQKNKNYDTGTSNNNKSKDTSLANNNRSYNQSIANNDRSYDQSIANNKRSYDTAVSNLQAVKANSEEAIQNAIKQSHLNDNAKYGSDGDISKFDKSMMAINFHVKTQSNDAIARTGDYFLRYGYAYEGNVPSVKFNLMKHFTFWKAREVWINSTTCNNKIISIFKSIFMNGVTVWNDPDEMGQNLLYDNTILN